MAADISFELARFEWVDPTRLELEGTWHGVSRRLARASLVIEVDGRRRRLRALPEDAGTPELWSAAFAWDGDDIPRLEGAELEVGRGIVVDLPRPRSSRARAQLPKEPIPATTRDDKDAGPGRAEAERILEALAAARAEAEEAREALARVRAERDALRAGYDEQDALRAEHEQLRAAHDELRAERHALRAEHDELRRRAEDADELRSEQEGLRSENQDLLDERDALREQVEEAKVLRARAAEADQLRAEQDDLRAQAEAAAAELSALREQKEVAPDVARLRAELETVERERTELRAQLAATQAMPPPTELRDQEDPGEPVRQARRFDRPRRPAERTAKRSSEPTVSLADKVSDWVGGLTGARDEDAGSTNGESHAAARTRAQPAAPPKPGAQPARRTRSAAAARTAQRRRRESPSWGLRVAALALLAFLLVTLVVILSSIL